MKSAKKSLTKGLAIIKAARILGIHVSRVHAEENFKACTSKTERAVYESQRDAIASGLADVEKTIANLVGETNDPVAVADRLLFESCISDEIEDGTFDPVSVAVARCKEVRGLVARRKTLKKELLTLGGILSAKRCSISTRQSVGGLGLDFVHGQGDTWEEALDKITK